MRLLCSHVVIGGGWLALTLTVFAPPSAGPSDQSAPTWELEHTKRERFVWASAGIATGGASIMTAGVAWMAANPFPCGLWGDCSARQRKIGRGQSAVLGTGVALASVGSVLVLVSNLVLHRYEKRHPEYAGRLQFQGSGLRLRF